MPHVQCVRFSTVVRSPRVLQLEGMFGLPAALESRVAWDASLPIEDRSWNIGLIVGPSGSGKSTLARELFGHAVVSGFDWPGDRSVVDGFHAGLGIKELTLLLSSVGFSSPPHWLRPFHVLSQGEQFRATMARALAEQSRLVVLDEFTSVVDRTVAQIGSAAIARTVRSRGQQFVAVSCHYDIVDWLDPDWTFDPSLNEFRWRCLQRRPGIELDIERTDRSAWERFRAHHYLNTSLSRGAQCFLAQAFGRPAAFTAVLPFPHADRPGWREHRTVCLPDFQGVGIGNALSEFVAGLYVATGRPYFSTTAHPAMVRHRMKSPLWRMHRRMSLADVRPTDRLRHLRSAVAGDRLTAGFEYVGPRLTDEARRLGVCVT